MVASPAAKGLRNSGFCWSLRLPLGLRFQGRGGGELKCCQNPRYFLRHERTIQMHGSFSRIQRVRVLQPQCCTHKSLGAAGPFSLHVLTFRRRKRQSVILTVPAHGYGQPSSGGADITDQLTHTYERLNLGTHLESWLAGQLVSVLAT